MTNLIFSLMYFPSCIKNISLCVLFLIFTTLCNAQIAGDETTSADKNFSQLNALQHVLYMPAKKDSANKKYKVNISGVLQVHYMDEFNTNGDSINDPGGFRILRARLTAKGKINKFTSYEIMIDPRAPEIGGILRDAFIAFQLNKNQVLRVGQQKTQFGYENRESDTKLFCVNRSEVSDNLSRGTNLRDIGIGLLGNIPLNKQYRLENAITFTNGSEMNVAGPWSFNPKKVVWGRAGFRYKENDLWWRAGISGAIGTIKDIGNSVSDTSDDFFYDIKRFGVDVEADNKFFFTAAEFVTGTDMINDTLSNEFGYYVLAAGKTKYNVGPFIRYDVLNDEWKSWNFGVYYGLPADKLRLTVNYETRGYHLPEVPYGFDDRLYIQLQLTFN